MIAPRFFDAHSHLQDPRVGPEVAGLLDRAAAAGVAHVVCCGTGPGDWEAVLALAAVHPQVVPMLGLHPWWVEGAAPGWERRLRTLLEGHRAGVGECGLDFGRGGDRERQLEALKGQLRMARALDRPVALHCVQAWGALLEVLGAEGLPQAGALVHGFGGSAETARALQRLGVRISFGGPGARPGTGKGGAAVRAVSLDHLLVESDTPDRGPGGGPSEPAQVPGVAAELAHLRGESLEVLAAATTANARSLFRRCMA